MACYDCEDCKKSVEYGGKCTRWEYYCPFVVFENQSKEDEEKLKEVLSLLNKAKEIMDCVDIKEDCEDGTTFINRCISEFEEYTSEELRKEWESIK